MALVTLFEFGSNKTPHEGREGRRDTSVRPAFGKRCVGKRYL